MVQAKDGYGEVDDAEVERMIEADKEAVQEVAAESEAAVEEATAEEKAAAAALRKADCLKFFDACESGKGWDACQEFCAEGAAFASQSGPCAPMPTIEVRACPPGWQTSVPVECCVAPTSVLRPRRDTPASSHCCLVPGLHRVHAAGQRCHARLLVSRVESRGPLGTL